VNIDQLMESLSENAPDPDHVLASFGRKRRAARNRMYTASGGLAVAVVAVVVGVLLHGLDASGTPLAESSSPASGTAVPAAAPSGGQARDSRMASGASASSGSCASVPLQAEIASAVHRGASVIVGYATLSGTSAASAAASGGPAGGEWNAATLRSVQTVAGPAIASGSTAWIPAPGSGSPSSGSGVSLEGQSLWAPSGELFAIAWPKAAAGSPVGPVLMVAPVVGRQVIFSDAGCWDITGLPATSYKGSTPLSVRPGGANVNGALASAGDHLYAVPLSAVEKIAMKG
jgi:hypothetical protein